MLLRFELTTRVNRSNRFMCRTVDDDDDDDDDAVPGAYAELCEKAGGAVAPVVLWTNDEAPTP
jgi:hypothetical protein